MSAIQRLVAAMGAVQSAHWRNTEQWLGLAQTDNALREAFRQVFGKRPPTPQKFGKYLTEHLGVHGEWLLEGRYSGHGKQWSYRVLTPAEAAEDARKRQERQAAREAASLEKIHVAADKERERIAARIVRKQEKQRAAAEKLSVNIKVMPPKVIEYESDTHVESDGRITRKPAIGRDGQPIRKAPPPSVAAEVQTAIGQAATRVERMRARYLAHHSGSVPTDAGFSDPGGVVSHNIATQGVEDSFTRRLRLRDF